MRVSVVYAIVGRVWEVDLDCPDGLQVDDVVRQALAHKRFADVSLTGKETYAVWNRTVAIDHVLREGDRVEILRSLIVNPMERRRMHAQPKSKTP